MNESSAALIIAINASNGTAEAHRPALLLSLSVAIVTVDVVGLVFNLPAVIWLIKHVNSTPMFYVLRAAAVTDVLMLAGQLVCSLAGLILAGCNCAESNMVDIIGVSFILRGIHQCNLWLTVLMSLERYVAICRPYLHQKLFSRKLLVGATVVIVLFSAVYSCRSLALLCTGDKEQYGTELTTSNCTFIDDPTGMLSITFGWYDRSHAIFAVVDHVLAMILLTASYMCILVELQRASKRWFELTLLRRTECSSSRMPTCIITIFFLFESPKVIMDVICMSGVVEVDHSTLYKDITTLLLQLCTATNVVVYFIFSETIRKRVLQLCGLPDSRLKHIKLFQRSGSQSSRADDVNNNSIPFITHVSSSGC